MACGEPAQLPGAVGSASSSEQRMAEPLVDPPASASAEVPATASEAGASVAMSPEGAPEGPPVAELLPPQASDPAATPAPAGAEAPSVPSDAPTVTLSFTFDDTYGPQLEAAAILDAHGLRGTFYVNSPELHRASANPNGNGPLSIAEVLDMQARGHDIGGHTLGHLSLTDVPEGERIREVLGDRAELVRLGIEARSFAYPYGHVEDDDASLGLPVLEVLRNSGYTSARDTNGFDLEDCAPGPQGLPPADPFLLVSTRSVNEPPDGAEQCLPADTAETLLGWADRAASCGGGWLPLVFHHLHADCSDPSAPESYCFDFGELDRLAAAVASGVRCPDGGDCYRVQVATVAAAIGVTELAPAPEVPGLRNPSLERALDSGETECILRSGASSSAVFSRSELANSGVASERLEIAPPFEAAAEIGVVRDFGACSIFATPGRSYELSLHYLADPDEERPTLRFVTYRLTADYDWVPWDSGPDFDARSPGEWVRLDFTTAAVPSDTIAISFGLRQESAGVINVDDLDSVPLEISEASD